MWLLKTEPGTYSYEDLEKEGGTRWDGVKNPVALRNLKAMKAGDRVVVYHTGDEKAAVGLAEVTREAYADPRDKRLPVIDIAPRGRLPRPVQTHGQSSARSRDRPVLDPTHGNFRRGRAELPGQRAELGGRGLPDVGQGHGRERVEHGLRLGIEGHGQSLRVRECEKCAGVAGTV